MNLQTADKLVYKLKKKFNLVYHTVDTYLTQDMLQRESCGL